MITKAMEDALRLLEIQETRRGWVRESLLTGSLSVSQKTLHALRWRGLIECSWAGHISNPVKNWRLTDLGEKTAKRIVARDHDACPPDVTVKLTRLERDARGLLLREPIILFQATGPVAIDQDFLDTLAGILKRPAWNGETRLTLPMPVVP